MQISQEERPAISPTPKRVTWGEGRLRMGAEIPIRLLGVGPDDPGVRDLAHALRRRGGARVTFGDGAPGRGAAPGVAIVAAATAAPRRPGAYLLRVTAGGITVAGADRAGVRHGLQTLRQLFEAAPAGGLSIPAVEVRDWPDFAVRGAHLTLFRYQNQRASVPFWRALIEHVAARAKLNTLIVQVDWMLRYRRRPEMGQETALPFDALKGLCDLGRARGIAMVPHLQCLSHQYSLVGHGHPEWLVKPKGETYRPDAPGLRPLLRDLMADLRDVFGPLPPDSPLGTGLPPLHVGLDEVGTLPTRAKESEADVFLRHLADLHEDARRLGFPRVAFWPDMLPRYDRKAQGRGLLPRVPTGTIVCPWDYDDRPDFPVLDPFVGRNFPVWATGSAKYHRDNLARLARAAHRRGCEGLIGSTWNSWAPTLVDNVARPLSGLLLAGEFGWNADAGAASDAPVRPVPYDPMTEIRRLLAGLSPVG